MRSLHSTPATTTAEPNSVVVVSLPPATSTTASTAGCPADNGSTYTVTNTVTPSDRPYKQAMYSSAAYEILCNTNFAASRRVVDLQAITSVFSLRECMNACALYSFQTPPYEFANHSCSGVAWEREWNMCWLKSNVAPSSTNHSSTSPPMPDGAVVIAT